MKKIVNSFVLLAALLLLGACDILPLQTNQKYDGKALDPHTGMSALEFIESKDTLSNMRDAIALCGLEDLYTQTSQKLTYLLLDNKPACLSKAEVLAAAGDPALKQALTNKLLFHIIQGEYDTYGSLSYDPTYVLTMYENQNYLLNMRANFHVSDRNTEGRIVVSSTYIPTGAAQGISAYSTNYLFTNGVGHFMESAFTVIP